MALFGADWMLEGCINSGFIIEDDEVLSLEELDPFNIKLQLYEAS